MEVLNKGHIILVIKNQTYFGNAKRCYDEFGP